jgi:hypothetical protein
MENPKLKQCKNTKHIFEKGVMKTQEVGGEWMT